MRFLLDTNILLRAAVRNDPQHALAAAAIDRLLADGAELLIAQQNVAEWWVVATRPHESNGLGFSVNRAERAARSFIASYDVLHEPPDALDRWLDLCVKYDVHGQPAHDTRLVVAMLANQVKHVLTLNPRDFRRYDEITCLTPEEVISRSADDSE